MSLRVISIIRAVASIAVGIVAIVWPSPTLRVLVMILGAYLLVDGVFRGVSALRFRAEAGAVPILPAIVSVALGILLLALPELSLQLAVVLLALWAIIVGAFELVILVRSGARPSSAIPIFLPAIIAVILGIVLLVAPEAGVVFVAVVFGIGAIFRGIALLVS